MGSILSCSRRYARLPGSSDDTDIHSECESKAKCNVQVVRVNGETTEFPDIAANISVKQFKQLVGASVGQSMYRISLVSGGEELSNSTLLSQLPCDNGLKVSLSMVYVAYCDTASARWNQEMLWKLLFNRCNQEMQRVHNWDRQICTLEQLLWNKADPNEASNGCTFLHVASQLGDTEVVELLCNAGAEKNLVGRKGYTPLSLASQQGHTEVVKFLCGARVDTNLAQQEGYTPLCIASYQGHIDVVKFLCGAGVDTNLAQNQGCTPLYIASRQGHTEVVKFLCGAGVDAQKATNADETPLYIASQFGHTEVVEILLLS